MKRCFDEYVYDEKLEGQVSLSLHRAVARFNGLSVPSSSACYWNPLSENSSNFVGQIKHYVLQDLNFCFVVAFIYVGMVKV